MKCPPAGPRWRVTWKGCPFQVSLQCVPSAGSQGYVSLLFQVHQSAERCHTSLSLLLFTASRYSSQSRQTSRQSHLWLLTGREVTFPKRHQHSTGITVVMAYFRLGAEAEKLWFLKTPFEFLAMITFKWGASVFKAQTFRCTPVLDLS